VPEAARADLESITHQAERLRRMVSQLLVASRLEAGVLTPQQEVFALRPLMERTWDALRADRPFELTVGGTPHLAVADPDRLEQVLWAVLDNAVKYSPPRSPISVRIQGHAGRLTLEVRDEGTGMDEVTRTRAFEQFYRSEQARKLAPDGSGVGLYAASGLMRAMGGDIEVESTLGNGTLMTITVPAEPSERGAE
jgi:signal transduction histidine kinase